jgi:hypothetical protein
MALTDFKPQYPITEEDLIRATVCVARGVTFLDERVPDWPTKVTQPVKIYSPTLCVIGQIFGDYDEWVTTEWDPDDADNDVYMECLRLGFIPGSTYIYSGAAKAAALEQVWNEVIAQRRAT